MSTAMKKLVFYSLIIIPLLIIMFISGHILATTAAEEATPVNEEARNWAFLGASIAVTGSTIGAGIALWAVGIGGTALLAERPEQFGAVLLLGGLAEGVAIYGLLVAILILGKV